MFANSKFIRRRAVNNPSDAKIKNQRKHGAVRATIYHDRGSKEEAHLVRRSVWKCSPRASPYNVLAKPVWVPLKQVESAESLSSECFH